VGELVAGGKFGEIVGPLRVIIKKQKCGRERINRDYIAGN
jgi:hypothetical protein